MTNSAPQTGTRLLYVSMALPFMEHLESLVEGEWRLVLCGPYPETAAELRAWLSDVGEECSPRINAARANGHVDATYLLPGRRVRVTSAASWFGKVTLSPPEARRLFERLQWHLKREFDREASVPLVTPASAGIALWRAEAEDQYPELDPEHQQLIQETSGQARSEVLTLPELDRIAEFDYWDMRLAYPSVTENLPVGPAVREEAGGLGSLELPAVGRVKVRFCPPVGWSHVGLLPEKHWGESHLSFPIGRECWRGWCDAREARLAVQNGWEVVVEERLVMQEGKPLNTWIRRLRRLHELFGDSGRPMHEPLLQAAVRRIMLAGPADMFGRGRSRVEWSESTSWRLVRLEIGQKRRTERVSHPEWPAAIWARTRYRLAKYMLAAPRETLLGCHLDCVYTAGGCTWQDRGEWGDLRLKGALLLDAPAPRTMEALRKLATAGAVEMDYLDLAGEDEADELAD